MIPSSQVNVAARSDNATIRVIHFVKLFCGFGGDCSGAAFPDRLVPIANSVILTFRCDSRKNKKEIATAAKLTAVDWFKKLKLRHAHVTTTEIGRVSRIQNRINEMYSRVKRK